jgi:hypothetical protein
MKKKETNQSSSSLVIDGELENTVDFGNAGSGANKGNSADGSVSLGEGVVEQGMREVSGFTQEQSSSTGGSLVAR